MYQADKDSTGRKLSHLSLEVRTDRIMDPIDGRWVHAQSVHYIIDGQDLLDVVREIESSYVRRGIVPGPAGGYIGLSPRLAFYPSRYLLGLEDEEDDKVRILQCSGCWIEECWPLEVRIKVGAEIVMWSDFENPFRPEWKYDSLGTIVFSRENYEHELSKYQAG